MPIKLSSGLNSQHPPTFLLRDSHLVLKVSNLTHDSIIHQNPKDVLNPVITSWNKLCQPSASSSDSSRSNHSTSTHPSVINTNEDSLEQDLSHTLSPTIPTHAFHEHAPLDVTQLGLGLRPTTAQDLQTRNRDQWTSDQIEQSSLTPDDQDHSHLFVAHPQLTHSPAALSSILPSSPSSSLPPTGSQLSEPTSRSSYPIQESNIESLDQDPVATAAYLFQSSLHSPTRGFHPHHLPTRSVSTPDRSHHNSLPLPSLIPPTPPLCTPPHLSHLLSPPHPGLSHPPSPLPIPQSAQIYQHQLHSRSSFSGPPPFYYGPNGFHPSLIGSSSSSSAYTSGSAYQSHFLPSPSPYHPFSNVSNGVGASRSASHGSPNLNPTFYTGLYYTPTSNKKPSQSKRRASAAHYSSQNTTSTPSSYKPPRMEKEGENEIDRLKNRLKGVRSKVRELEVENQRKERELEIARWRLECVGVEKGLEEIETQKAIHHFLERAERSESYLKVLELKLNHQASLSSSLSNSTLNTKEEENEGFLRDDHEMEMNLDKEMHGLRIENGAEMKSVKTNMMMNEKEREENETNVNRIRKWQVVNEMDYDSLEIEFDE
ncbi:hypothetical protein DFH28DRAFT_1181487 [Melampsora americana]|nr:hypothetical protein DFH28DRAFT_1181487 [Melampsora americana]